MKVLLTKDVASLGRAGDIKEVSDGHARNFLIPRHLALPATSALLGKVQKEEAEHQAKIKKEQAQAVELKNRLEGKVFTIKAKADLPRRQAGKQNLFAAIKPAEIVKAINDKLHTELAIEQIIIKKPLKSLGLHEVEIRLAPNALCVVKLNIESVNN